MCVHTHLIGESVLLNIYRQNTACAWHQNMHIVYVTVSWFHFTFYSSDDEPSKIILNFIFYIFLSVTLN